MTPAIMQEASDLLAEEVLASHFTLVDRPGGIERITLDGADGWSSPNPHPVLSLMRWETADRDIATAALDEALEQFRQKGHGFDWMTGPFTEHLVPLLYERGFIEPPLNVAAMAITISPTVDAPETDGLNIWKVDDPHDTRIPSIMARGFDVPQEVGAIYHDAYLTPSSRQRSEVYAVSVDDSNEPVGVGYLSYIGDGPSVLLRVSSTLEGHRGRGIYRALVVRRLLDAAREGRKQAFVHAYSAESQRVLAGLGFSDSGRLQLHRWRP